MTNMYEYQGLEQRFCKDLSIWNGDVCFKVRFHRLFNLELQKDISVAHKLQLSDSSSSFRRRPRGGLEESQWNEMSQVIDNVVLSPINDRWRWTLNGNGFFSVSSVRKEIDKRVVAMSSSPTRWSTILPIKVNVFIWRMFLDKLPTRSNLSARGVDVPCVLCPVCDSEVESRNHLFFGCSLVSELHRLISRWWNIHIPLLIFFPGSLGLRTCVSRPCISWCWKPRFSLYGGMFGSLGMIVCSRW
ncbi:reverse transcriptase domain, Reverse transcriptase zinc-binding domain protein [Artemisia annua]|uniref:Reverse transcriptase domain, Reverse transcriptase zinc-binding domain protein n=1 Tax=Artemisia annua TaxID=35608 RepID=A0A2U1LEL0_ARTAN|nr:reverse transcriptase domain, Reverse transcriptase zinc-binding domain protein [Artemisia annua]